MSSYEVQLMSFVLQGPFFFYEVIKIYEQSTKALSTDVTKSERNRRRKRTLQIFQKKFTFDARKINVKQFIL